MKPKTPNTLKALTQDPANLRQHNERNIGMIADALKEVGAARSIVIDEQGRILAGNGTVTAAEKAGLTKVKVIDTDGDTIIAVRRRGLTEEQKRQLAIYDNRTAETATWDTAGLAALLEHDASALDGLFTEKELAAMLDRDLETIAAAGGSEPPNPTEQKLKAWQRKWKTAVNQVWQLGDHRLAIGSATTAHVWSRLMGDYDRAALVFTDPPYGVSYASERTGSIQNDDLRKNALTGLLKPAFELMARHAHDTAAFYIWHASATRRDFEWAMDAAGLQENQYLSWVKDSFVLGHADYHWQTEPCQPGDTMVSIPGGQKRIDELQDGDGVISYDSYSGQIVGMREGRKVKVAKRQYQGDMFTISCDGRKTRATDGHQFTARFSAASRGIWNTYLMKKGEWWRIGIMRTFNSRGFGPRIRLEQEQGEQVWLLTSHETKVEAMVEEQFLSIEHGIPTTHWETERNKNSPTCTRTKPQIESIYQRMNLQNMDVRAKSLLVQYGRRYEYPIATNTSENRTSCHKTARIRACNLIPVIMELPIPTTKSDFRWSGIESVERQQFTGSVYSLDVERDHHYIADGIVTHNCFYCQKAGQRAAFFGNRKQSTIWRITRTAADPGSTINLANGLHLSDGQASNLYLRPTTPKAGKALRHLRLDADQAVSIITSAATDAWEIRRDNTSDYIHPNQKPPELAIRAINNSTPGPDAIVVDCFAGSGSTLIACERTRRQFRGIELDPKFAAAILERWSAETGKTPKPAKGGTV